MEKLKDEISVKNESQEIDLSFWDVLHDATLKQIVSDAMERTVMLEFEIEYLREFANLPTGISWCLIFHDASKLLARRWDVWPGPEPNVKGLDRKEESALIEEYKAKGRTVSIGWNEFEKIVSTSGIWVKDATIHLRASGTLLDSYGHDNATDTLFEFKVVAGSIQCERSDGNKMAIEEFLNLGEAYWNAFSERKI